jgi:hypothetical protein
VSDEYNEDEDDVTRAVRIMWDIQRGVKKDGSRYVNTEEHTALWDGLVVQLAENEAKGGTADSSIRMREDNWTPTGEWIDPDE